MLIILIVSTYVKETIVELCWRKCGNIENHAHIFWDCPVSSRILEESQGRNPQYFTSELATRPTELLLGAIPKKTYSSYIHIVHIVHDTCYGYLY